MGFRRRRARAPLHDPPRWRAVWRTRRILIEHPDPDVRLQLAAELRNRDLDVLTCGGPRANVSCPLLADLPCPAVDGADLLVTGLVDTEVGRRITERIRTSRPELAILVDGAAERRAEPRPWLRARAVHPLEAERIVQATHGEPG